MKERKTRQKILSLAEQKALVTRSKKDPAVFGQIYDANFDTIFHYILYRTGDVSTAEDLSAQTFYNALKNLWKFRWTGISITAWLYRIATNEVNGHFRQQQKRMNTHIDMDEIADRIPDEANRLDHELEKAQEIVAQSNTFLLLNKCICELKPEEQALITMRYFEKKSYRMIAEILGKREGTLRMRNKRALEKLKEELEKQGIKYDAIEKSFNQHPYTQDISEHIPAESATGSA